MMNSGILAGFGFIFWNICTRLFNPEIVGLGNALISLVTLLITISTLGFGMSIIRFLPLSQRKDRMLNSLFTLSAPFCFSMSLLCLLSIKTLSPRLSFVRENILYSAIFIITPVFAVLSLLSESVFLSEKRTKYTLVKNAAFSILKILFLFVFVPFGAFGILLSVGISHLIAFILSFFMILSIIPHYHFNIQFSKDISDMATYSFMNYVAQIIASMPGLLFPLIIINFISAEQNAYFFIPWMIASTLYVIPSSIASSFFAESSENITEMEKKFVKAMKFLMIILIFVIPVLLLFGYEILRIFGESYAHNGYSLLFILTISILPVGINGISIIKLNIRKEVRKIVLFQALLSTVIFCIGIPLLFSMGIIGIAIGYFLAHCIGAFCFTFGIIES